MLSGDNSVLHLHKEAYSIGYSNTGERNGASYEAYGKLLTLFAKTEPNYFSILKG